MREAIFSLNGKRVFVAGHRGMVGRALVRALEGRDVEVLTIPRQRLDLRDREAVRGYLKRERPDLVIVAAAKVGGIFANDTYPSDFLFDNLELQTALIRGAFEADVERLNFLGSSCVYPKFAEQPIREDALLTGPLEPTNQWYAVAKIAGIKMCQALMRQYGAKYTSVMPTNLYGPFDNFDLATSHVLPALMRKAHEAKDAGDGKSLVLWGTGTPRREFMHVDDCAAAILHVCEHYEDFDHINVGTGEDIAIRDVADLVKDVVGFAGPIEHDLSKPDGTPRKRLDVARLKGLGWAPTIDLRDGLATTYDWFIENHVRNAA